ncbi:hypothetical protein [Clavibacter michiganensis]|jgi:hypothetical protein|uniref:hypothetical protein n=1 Tax=Clavibacter michiganensis TaxID=28447 RepID=UPI000ACF8B06|nr:hypothetical protein [Clavibacter michiganensis]
MQAKRGWSIALGVLLIAVSIFTFVGSAGQLPAYLSAGGCLVSGIVVLAVASTKPVK